MLRYLSVCSGIEAFSVAVKDLPFKAVGFCEIEPFPCAVLKERFPNIPNFGDIKSVTKEAYPDLEFDILVGGTPCQSFSIAGKKEGLKGVSGLAFEYIRITQEFKPRWIIWENVPGVLSCNNGDDFKTFLQALNDSGYSLAWRVLDAEFFGVPQRRRRVFLVGHLGEDFGPVEVLFEFEGSGRNSEKGEQTGQGDAVPSGESTTKRSVRRGQFIPTDSIGISIATDTHADA